MIKKLVVLAVVGVVAVTLVGGSKLGSYIRSEFRAARKQAEDSIPPEKEIERLKSEVTLLDGDVKKLVHQLAKERVEVNQLKERVDEMAAKQVKDKELFNARADAVEKAEGLVSFGGRSMNVAAALEELKTDKKRLDNAQKSLAAHETLLANRIKIRDSLEKQLIATQNQKSELAGAIEEMEADLALLKLQQAESKYQTDDTRLARIKDDLRKLRTKVEVKREELKLTQTYSDPMSAAPTATSTTGGQSVKDEVKSLRDAVNGTKKPEDIKKAD